MRTAATLLLLVLAPAVRAQDSITLFGCYRNAALNAPRLADRELITSMAELRNAATASGRYPSLDLNGKVSYQSDVVTIALAESPIPVEFPRVPHDQYGINLELNQTLYDGGYTRRKQAYDQARTAVDLQQIEVDLHALKERVNSFFFSILALQENMKSLEIHMDDLEKRRAVMQSAYREGSLLESDLKKMDVEILHVKKSMVEITAARKSLMDALGLLCGQVYSEESVLALPRLEQMLEGEGTRPELEWFDLQEASMENGRALVDIQRMPVVYAFGQTGYGKPGLNMLSGEWDFYYLAGAGFRWKIWDWKRSRREMQVISNQQQIIRNQRTTFQRELGSRLVQEQARMEQHKKTIALEEQVLLLQQEVAEDASTRLANGTITVTDFLTELNRVNLARINLVSQKIQYMQSVANILTIQGIL